MPLGNKKEKKKKAPCQPCVQLTSSENIFQQTKDTTARPEAFLLFDITWWFSSSPLVVIEGAKTNPKNV